MTKPAPQQKPASLQDWHKADIKAALEKRGLSLARLSLKHSFSRGACARALEIPWSRMERVIADAIGVHPKIIWPSRYHDDGAPKRSRHSGQSGKSIRGAATRLRKAA